MAGAAGEEQGRRPLSLDRIVDATLALIDEQGVGVTSMRTVGERLGVRAMSLYRYIDNREELFDAVVERIVGELDDDAEVTAAAHEAWRPYLTALAGGVRRYARAHPHAFPLVATRPSSAPWVNPPLRSLRWIETLLSTLRREGFTDEQALFAYRSFNSFLLGFLLLETSAMTLRDPQPGDGSFSGGGTPAAADPVPGGLSPARSGTEEHAVDDAPGDDLFVAPLDARRFPTLVRLRAGLSDTSYDDEFDAGLTGVLDRIADRLADR